MQQQFIVLLGTEWVQRMTGSSPVELEKTAEISVKTDADPFVLDEQDFVS